MRFRRDTFGIPVLGGEDVENIAERFLVHVAPHVLQAPAVTPLAAIMQQLQAQGHCTFSFGRDLGSTVEGYKYLGYYDLKRKHIAIDASLSDQDVRFPFTVAHELGHFYLHGRIDPRALRAADVIRDSTRDLVTHRIDASNPRTLLEWQANKFAAAVLMPRATARDAVIDIQRERGIARNLGSIWLDRQAYNSVEYKLTMTHLATFYRVSRSVARFRLRELGILRVDPKTMPTRANESLGDILADLFSPAGPNENRLTT